MRSPNDGSFEATLPEIVLMDFYTRTCSFCREEALILEELAEVFAGKVELRMVDAEMDRKLAGEYVSSSPYPP